MAQPIVIMLALVAVLALALAPAIATDAADPAEDATIAKNKGVKKHYGGSSHDSHHTKKQHGSKDYDSYDDSSDYAPSPPKDGSYDDSYNKDETKDKYESKDNYETKDKYSYQHGGEDSYSDDKYDYKMHSYGGSDYCSKYPFHGNPANVPGTTVLALNQRPLRVVGKDLGCAPIVGVTVLQLTQTANVDSFIARRQAAADRISLQFPGVHLAYVKGAGLPSNNPFPQPGLQFWQVGVLTVQPSASAALDWSAAFAADPDVIATTPDVISVVRVSNFA